MTPVRTSPDRRPPSADAPPSTVRDDAPSPPETSGGAGWTEASLAALVLIWGVNFSVAKWALAVFDPLVFNALRFVAASLLVGAALRLGGRVPLPRREDVPRVLALGLAGNVLYQMAFILGLDRTYAGHASLMLATVPVWVPLLSLLRGEERPGARTWTGVLASVAGVGMVTGSGFALEGGEVLLGDAILLGAAVVWALYTVGARPLVRRYGSLAVTAWTLWVGTVGLVAAGVPALPGQRWEEAGPAAWGALLFSGVFSIAVAYLIWNRAVDRLGGTRTAIFSNLTPVVALAVGALWLGERLTPLSLLGAALVIGGVAWVRGDRGAPAPIPPAPPTPPGRRG